MIIRAVYSFVFRFLFYKFFCTNLSKVELEILRNSSTIFRSSHGSCSIKKAILTNFVIFTGKHLCWGLFFDKVAGLQASNFQACNFIKKRLQHRYYLVKIGKSIRTPILRNIWEWLLLHFSEHFSDYNLHETNFWWNKNGHLLCERLVKSVKIEQKCQKQPPEVFCEKKVFLRIPQISQENTYVRVSFW